MSDTLAAPAAQPAAPAAPAAPAVPIPAPPSQPVLTPPAQETDWKAEARKWEERAKENKAAADRLAALEKAQKTEAQKLADRAAAAEAKLAAYQAREQQAAWAREVADASGLPEDKRAALAAALRGTSRDEIEAHAKTLIPLIASASPNPKDPPVPTVGITPNRPGNVPLRDQIAAAEKAGDKALVAALKAMQLGAVAPNA